MNFYWLYDLNIYILFILIVGFITITGLSKTYLFPDYFTKKFNIEFKHNEFIIGFLSLTGAFLSITIGLIIVGTYENFEQTEDTIRKEASQLFTLYKNVELLDTQQNMQMLDDLKAYADYIIQKEWKLQQKGKLPKLSSKPLRMFEKRLKAYQLKNEKDIIVFEQAIQNFDTLIELRHYRISIVKEGLPASIYVVLIFGLLINILISWLIVNNNRSLEIMVYTLTGILAGILVFIIISMDYPFRGDFSVTAEAFEDFLSSVAP